MFIQIHSCKSDCVIATLIGCAILTIVDCCFAQQRSPAVSVALPIQTQTADFDFNGTLEPAQQAEVRAAVDGSVQKVLVENGDLVTESQLLVQLDARSLEQQISSANAEIGKLKAELEGLDQNTAEALKKAGNAEASDEEKARITAARDLVAANIQVKDVELQSLRSDLEATKITAPLAGRVSGLSLKSGDDVYSSPASATLVCQITQTNPVRACIDVDQTTLNELRKLNRADASQSSQHPHPNPLPKGEGVSEPLLISMAVGNDPDFKYSGSLDYLGSRADSKTGQVRVCVVFPNPDGALDAAALASKDEDRAVRIRFTLQLPRAVLLATDLAVGQDRDGRNFVLAVNDKNQIEVCPVTLGPKHEGMQVIESGLKPDQWIVIGTPSAKLNPTDTTLSPIDFSADIRFGNLRPGAMVQPVKVPMPRPGKNLRDKTREEVEQQKAIK
jgi:RND family efflux transporter MFP subunit